MNGDEFACPSLDGQSAFLRACSDLAALRVKFAGARVARLLKLDRRYREDQPRVPAGQTGGGQWTDGGGSSTRLAQAESNDARKYSVSLIEEEKNGGHTLQYHIAKNDDEVRAILESRTMRGENATAYKAIESAYDSVESANNFVNRTLESNKSLVDAVSNGSMEEQWVTKRFGFVTGREAFRQETIENVVVRKTYNAGVFIRHDSKSPRGYRVITSYPFNDDTE